MKRISIGTAVLLVVTVALLMAQQVSPLYFPVNAQSGTTYTVLATDCGKLVTFNNGSAVAVTLPQSSATFFPPGCTVEMTDYGAGTATITPTTSTINNGGSNYALLTGQSVKIYADASNNYQVAPGKGTGLPDPGANGLVVRTASLTTSHVSIAVTAPLTVSNADGTAGNPTVAAPWEAVNTVSFSSTPTFNLSLGQVQTITLTGNVTSSSISNGVAGEVYQFIICQDGTGGRTFVWPSGLHGTMTIGSTLSLCSSQLFTALNSTTLYAVASGLINQ